MILCINPNAAIDKTVIVSPFRLNEIHRPQQVMAIPGGKGCNVARALKCLGEQPVVSGWVGGFAGQFIEAGLRREGIQTNFVHIEAESRACLSILDPESNTLTEIYEKGDPISGEKIDEFEAHFRDIVNGQQAVTLSGSLPPGVQADFYARMIELAHTYHVPAVLDTGGEALKRGLAAKPLLIKPNKKEFADLVGKPLDGLDDLAHAAADVATHYQTIVILSLGPEGAIAATAQEILHGKPPLLEIKSAVGSGDCMLAGVTYGLTHSFSLSASLEYGVAAGTANALSIGAGIFNLDDFERVRAQVTINKL